MLGIDKLFVNTYLNFTFDAAGSDYDETSSSIVFIEESINNVSVQIIADDTSEASEKFYGKISMVDSLPSNVRLEPVRAEVTITENKGA